MVYRNGSITIRGASVDIKIGDFVKESVFRNYPNYIYEVEDKEITEPVTPVVEEPKDEDKTNTDVDTTGEADSVKDETPVDETEASADEETTTEPEIVEPATEAKPKRGKNK